MEQLQRYTKLSYRVVFPFELRLFNTVSSNISMEKPYALYSITSQVFNKQKSACECIKIISKFLAHDNDFPAF